MSEIWKDIEGYDGAYQVSSFGNVRSWKDNSGIKKANPKMLKGGVDNHGYSHVCLSKGNKKKTWRIHKLVR